MRRDFSFRNTIFIRLITTFVLIMLPILLLGVYIYQWSIRTASDDISKTAVSQISFYLNDLENEIERMKLLQYGMLEDADLNKLAIAWETMGKIERMEKVMSVLGRTLSLQNSSTYINNVSIHIQPIAKTISSLNGASEFDVERYRAIRTEFGGQGTKLIEWKGNFFLSAAKPSGLKRKEPLFIVEIELDSRKLRQALQQFNTYPDSSTILISNQTEFEIGSGSVRALGAGGQELHKRAAQIPNGGSGLLLLEDQRYFVSHAYSEQLDMSIYRFIPEQIVLKPLNKFYTWAWIFAAGAFAIMVIFALSTYKFIHKPLLKLVRGFSRLENGDLEQAIVHDANDEFRYIYERFNQMIVNLRSLIDQAYKQKIMAQRAELKQLQSQINPHFLYNSFFVLHRRIKGGDFENALHFSQHLGNYFRYLTRSADDEVPLFKEVEHASLFAEIQGMRFSNRIRIDFGQLPPEFAAMNVPRLILQPIIENAFEHGLEQVEENGRLSVQFVNQGDCLCISVQNNGGYMEEERLQSIRDLLNRQDDAIETTGIINIHRRIRLYFGEGSGLSIEQNEMGGVKVVIRLPVMQHKGGEMNVSHANC